MRPSLQLEIALLQVPAVFAVESELSRLSGDERRKLALQAANSTARSVSSGRCLESAPISSGSIRETVSPRSAAAFMSASLSGCSRKPGCGSGASGAAWSGSAPLYSNDERAGAAVHAERGTHVGDGDRFDGAGRGRGFELAHQRSGGLGRRAMTHENAQARGLC